MNTLNTVSSHIPTLVSDNTLVSTIEGFHYADHICYSRPICSSEGFAIVQRDIDLIGHWSSSNGLKFNNDKCQWMFISKRSKNPECHTVDLFVKVKYLGVRITHNLNWAAHIHSVVSKTRQTLGFLYHKLYKLCKTTVLRKLYVSLTHSNLEYCCIILDLFTKGSIEHLEKKHKSWLQKSA